jgi:hypothetical protein
LPAECEWQQLAPSFQDDNRHSADHIDYKLARIGYAAGDKTGETGSFAEQDIEMLAAVEHGRWAAGKYLEGWAYGESRDDARFLHPSLIPYADLPESEKEKDRANVREIPALLSMASQSLRCHFRCGVLVAKDADGNSGTMIADRLASWQAAHPERHLLVSLAIDDERKIAIGEALAARGIALEIVQHQPVFAAIDSALAQRAAALLRKAARIVIPDKPSSEYIEVSAEQLVLAGTDSLPSSPRAARFTNKDMIHGGWLA